jgi:hypothetical protein
MATSNEQPAPQNSDRGSSEHAAIDRGQAAEGAAAGGTGAGGAASGAGPASPEQALPKISDALRGLRYGSVLAIVQDGKVVQIERTEKTRFGK